MEDVNLTTEEAQYEYFTPNFVGFSEDIHDFVTTEDVPPSSSVGNKTKMKGLSVKRKIWPCPCCTKKYIEKSALYEHIYKLHADQLPDNMGPAQFCFNIRNKKSFGTCVMCRTNKTKWNEEAERYERFCSTECRNKYVAEAKRRMVNKYGKVHLLNDPEMQKKMLNSKGISGTYYFQDGSTCQYVGSYEEDFLKTLDLMLGYTGKDVIQCPETFEYEYDGKKHAYIPDFYLPNFNLIVEIKDGGDNPNMHHKIQSVDKVKEKIKDKIMLEQIKFNYIKIVNKDYRQFVYLIKMIQNTSWDDPEFKNYKNGLVIIPEE